MKPTRPVRISLIPLGIALRDAALRVREEYGELVLDERGFGLRIRLRERAGGSELNCQVSVTELGFAPGSLGLFGEMASEGYPVVGVGACRGRISCEFAWFHPDGVEPRISAERCRGLVDRVVGARVGIESVRLRAA